MASYTFRNSLFDTAITHLIQGDELILRRGDGFEEYTRLDEIRSMRMRSGYSKTDGEWHECTIRTSHGTIRLRSLHRLGFRRFESRLGAYQRFVQALQDAVTRHAPNVRTRRDSPPSPGRGTRRHSRHRDTSAV